MANLPFAILNQLNPDSGIPSESRSPRSGIICCYLGSSKELLGIPLGRPNYKESGRFASAGSLRLGLGIARLWSEAPASGRHFRFEVHLCWSATLLHHWAAWKVYGGLCTTRCPPALRLDRLRNRSRC